MCDNNAFGIPPAPIDAIRAETLKRALSDYKMWAGQQQIPLSYQIGQLTPSMVFGSKAGRNELKTKAAET
eukprot:91798-Pyramimonas_sp.AAC.1